MAYQPAEVIIPNPTIKCGMSSTDYVTINNCRRIMFQPVNVRRTPQLALNTTNPIGFFRPHKWIHGEVHTLSHAYNAFSKNGSTNKAFIVPNGDDVAFPYFEAFVQDGGDPTKFWKYTFTNLIPIDFLGSFEIAKEVVFVYPFDAYYVIQTPPS